MPHSVSVGGMVGGEGVGGASDIEPPAGFPRVEAAAGETAEFVGCPRPFAVETWTLASSRGWRDARDVPIRSWPHYLKSCWTFAQNREAKDKARNGAKPKAEDRQIQEKIPMRIL